MKNLCLGIAVFLFLVHASMAFSEQREARVWHVSSKQLPAIDAQRQVGSIAEALARVGPGDTIIIHGGIYREEIVVDKSGSAARPITIRAAVGEHVVATGAERLQDWKKEEAEGNIFSTDWAHKFVTWTKHGTHPDDDYHRMIGRCEQVFVNGYPLHQVLERKRLSRGAFYVDLDAGRLYAWSADNQDLSNGKMMVEASRLPRICLVKGSYVIIKGICFRYAANWAQHGAVEVAGDDNTIENCVFEYTNSSGATFRGERITVRDCVFQYNGQLGFGASRAHKLLMTGCLVQSNNIKGFDRGWEAGGNKIAFTREAVIESSIFRENRGDGIWFDIGNEDCEVKNCLIVGNENAGIFYEISYGLHAHDNVILGNGFAFTSGAWGAAAGISLSSSPGCVIERNLLLGNKEGFNLREQKRSTPKIDGGSEPVWNHDHIFRNNVVAYNRDAQVWGWFDISDERHWPKAMQTNQGGEVDGDLDDSDKQASSGLSLERLNLSFERNLYWAGPGQGLFNWGVTWKRHKKYGSLDDVFRELGLEKGSASIEFEVKDFSGLDLRIGPNSPAVKMGCYPRGEVPGVRLGIYSQ